MKSSTVKSLIPGFGLAAFLAVILPLQSYLGNLDLFVFTPGRLALELAVLFVALSAVLSLPVLLFRRFPSLAYYSSFLTALLVCVYLESGFLSIGIPEINGGYMPELARFSRGVIDVSVWAVVVFGFLACARILKNCFHWIALAILVLGAASLLDVRKPQPSQTSQTSQTGQNSHFAWQYDVISNVKFSPKRNVLVFVLDSMGAKFPIEVLEGDPALKAKFAGFTAYTNNVAMHDCTKFGLPGLMTGVHFDPKTMTSAEYPMTMFGEESLLKPYLDAGADVAFSPDLLPYGLTTLPIEKKQEVKGKQKYAWSALMLRTREVPYFSLFNLTLFRLMPYPAKGPFLYGRLRKDPMFERAENVFWHEHVMYPLLAQAPAGTNDLFLGVFHSWGAHPPYTFNLDGTRATPSGDSAADMHRQIRNCFTHLTRLFDALREKGIYDSSVIVLCADHGNICERGSEQLPERSIFWVKPANAGSAALATSPIPVSSAEIAPLVRSARTTGAIPGPVPSGKPRLYREQMPGHVFRDIVAE